MKQEAYLFPIRILLFFYRNYYYFDFKKRIKGAKLLTTKN